MPLEEQLYHILRSRLGDYLDLDQLGQALGVDPSSVREKLDVLKNQGAAIESHPVLGHRLAQLPEALLSCELSYELATRCFGQWLQFHREVDSTNDLARQLAGKQAPEGTLVVAETQRAGRGRRGRIWHSPPRTGLWCSLLLYPHPQTPLGLLTLLFGVAIARTMRLHCGVPATLKWPNDIQLEGRKVAGILCEHHAVGDDRSVLVAGFGINVNQTDFPPDLQSSATSLRLHTGYKVDRCALLKRLLLEIEQDYLCAAAGGEDLILAQARKFSSTLGQRVVVRTDDQTIRGRAVGLDPSGALILTDERATPRLIHVGDVHHLENPDDSEIRLDAPIPGS